MVLSKSVRAIFIYIIAFVICVIFPLQAQAIPPNTSITLDPARPNTMYGWYSTGPSITLNSNVAGTTFYQWNSMSGPWTLYTGSFNAPDGNNTLYYYSQTSSNPDDIEKVKFAKIKVGPDPNDPPTTFTKVHGNFFDDTDLCVNCHRSHTGVAPGLLKGTGSTVNAAMKLCYTCHDGTQSKYNIFAQMGETPEEKASQHPVPRNLIACTNCHDPHLFPDTNPRLFGSTITDPNGADQGPVTGNDNSVCKACHPNPIANSAYNGPTIFGQTRHALVSSSGLALTRWEDRSFGPGMCGNCHNPHGSDVTDLRRGNESATGINNLCYGCHDDAQAPSKPADYFYQGKTKFSSSAHGDITNLATLLYIVWPNPSDTGKGLPTYLDPGKTQPGAVAGECINCHNPHGKDDGSGNPFPKLTMAKEEGLCFSPEPTGCHSAVTGSVNGIDIEERFSYYPTASNSKIPPPIYTGSYTAQHNITDADQDQLASGSKVECKNCHNPHLDSQTNKKVNPDNTSASYADTTPDPFSYSSVVIRGTSSIQDTKIKSGSTTPQETSPNNYLTVGRDSAGTWRTLIKFDLALIPPSANIANAYLILYEAAGGNYDLTFNIYPLTESWTESAATWYKRDAANNWSTAGGAYDSNVVATKNLIGANNFYSSENFDVTNLVSGWYQGQYQNNGMILTSNANTDGSNANTDGYYRSFNSSEESISTANTPSLVVLYTNGNPVNNVIDEAGFCLKCHDENAPATVTMPLGLKNIDPTYLNQLDGERHGAKASRGDGRVLSSLRSPYYNGMPALPCTECHDAHGSSNIFHLKENIRGRTVTAPDTTASSIRTLCQACHDLLPGHHGITETLSCFNCHHHRGKLEVNLTTNRELF